MLSAIINLLKKLFGGLTSTDTTKPDLNRTIFFDEVRNSLFNGKMSQSQVDGMNVLLDTTYDMQVNQRAYILATAKHETAHTMLPVRETLAKTDQQAINRLEYAWKTGKLPWVKTPYWRPNSKGLSYFGRGYVQLTWENNYRNAGNKLGVDLVDNPGLALDSGIAAEIIRRGMEGGWFTGKKLSNYLTPTKTDYVGARRIVNGTDKASQIASIAVKFEKAIDKSIVA